jgi:DNA-binding Xre family transcriptional regulator
VRKVATIRCKSIGRSLQDFLNEEGILAEVEKAAVEEVVALQILQMMEEKKISKLEMAKRMGTSRSALDRLLDPHNPSVSLKTLDRAAASLGKKLSIQLI